MCALLVWDIRPQLFPSQAHALLGAFPLAMAALTCVAHQAEQSAVLRDWFKTALLAAAFLFWAANQCLSDARAAIFCNDVAIALFILDLVLVIAFRPATPSKNEIAQTAIVMQGRGCCCGAATASHPPASLHVSP